MFARISGSMASDLIEESPSSYPANAWIWSEQTIAAQRRRLGCPPFQSTSKSGSSSSGQDHRGALVVCRASSSRRHKAAQAPLRRPPRWRNAPAGYLRTGLYSAGSSSSSLRSTPLKQQQQPPLNPDVLTACIEAAVHYHELEALCNTFLNNASFSIQHAALVLSRLHKVHSRKQDSQLLLVELLAAKLQSSFSAAAAAAASSHQQPQLLSPSEVAAVCWSFAKVGYQPHAGLLQPLLQEFWSGVEQQQCEGEQGSRGHHGTLSQLAAGLAGLGLRDPAVWARLRAAVMDTVSQLQPSCLQQLVWAFATAHIYDAAMISALANAVLERIEHFEAEELAQAVWCFHVLGYDSSELYEQASHQMVARAKAAAGCGNGVRSSTMSKQAGSMSKAEGAAAAQQQSQPDEAVAVHVASGSKQQQLQQTYAQQQQLQPLMQRPQLPVLQQSGPKPAQIALRLPHTLPQGQHSSREQCSSSRQQSSAARGSLGRTAADLYSAAASQAYSVLEQYDPLLCTLALYRDYFQPAQASC